MNNTNNQGVSRKVIKVWEDWYQVGIWENCKQSVKLYEDRAIIKIPYVKWVNNSGSLDWSTERVTGKMLALLSTIAKQEVEDQEDYTDQVMDCVREYNY
jgi:hypothetical protein